MALRILGILRGGELLGCVFCGIVAVLPAPVDAQTTTRLAVLQAEDRRAPTPADLARLRSGAHSADAQTVRAAVRALGRLERPALIAEITAALRHAAPEVRLEAATAIGQASQGWKRGVPPRAPAVDAALTPLVARLKVEADPDVRAAICETLGRMPYVAAVEVDLAERTLLDMASRADSVTDRLGVAKGFESLLRLNRSLRAPSDAALAVLRRLAVPGAGEPSTGARVRRLSLEALVTADAVDDALVAAAARDLDSQVRRLVMRAASGAAGAAARNALAAGVADDSPIVRIEALRAFRPRGGAEACAASVAASVDRDMHVALVALDQLAACGTSAEAVAVLERAVQDLAEAALPRRWHRAAHALVSLATAAPDRVGEPLGQLTESRVWQLRMYAARTAAVIDNRELLEHLAGDDDDNVREAALEGLKKIAGHAADAVFVSQLTRHGYQVLRAAALALDGTSQRDTAVPALSAAWNRLTAEGRDNSHDARDAIAKALASAGGRTPPHAGSRLSRGQTPLNDLSAEELRRLASPRARVTIRDVGTFELALFTVQAPATVVRFAHLAEAGYYNGLTFHRVVPNFVIQGGSPGANEYIGDAMYLRDEVGSWPHVRGAVGISTRGRDTGDAQIFIDLVDNPRLDHEYTVFAQVLNGIDIVDRILEGDVIEKVEIIP